MQSQELESRLRRIGLNEKESLVYRAVLELGSAFPSKIAEIAKLNRSTVYKILTNLAVRGLITEIERNKKLCYQVERPEKLLSFARDQVHLAEDRFEATKKILPDIEGLFASLDNKPKVRFFEGMAGVRTVYEEHIKAQPAYEMLGFSNVGELTRILPKTFLQNYVKAKARLGVVTRGLVPETGSSLDYSKKIYSVVDKKFWPKLKFVQAERFGFRGEITVYGANSVSIVNFKNETPIGVIVEDSTIASMMRLMFDLAWEGTA